jgi:hypothetical protein
MSSGTSAGNNKEIFPVQHPSFPGKILTAPAHKTGLFYRYGGSQYLPPPSPPSFNHKPAIFGLHPHPETMSSFPAKVTWLIRSFRHFQNLLFLYICAPFQNRIWRAALLTTLAIFCQAGIGN